MDVYDSPNWLLIPLQILFVDLLLGADNALLIALACRSLPPRDAARATSIGLAGAISLRLLMTMVATSLLAVPLIKLASGIALIVIALNLCEGAGLGEAAMTGPRSASRLWSAAAVIVVADAAMSLDNVVALAAIARGNYLLLAAGVALSLPVLGYGGALLVAALRRAPGLVTFGAALLGWIGGGMAISDPIVGPWADLNAPGLVAVAPALGAAFVFLQARLARRAATATRPARGLRAAPSVSSPPAPRPSAVDAAPLPERRVETPPPATRDDRIAIIGVVALAIVAGAILTVASYIDSFN